MFYAVKKGFSTGIFEKWSEAQKATTGFSNPEFKKFRTKEEAEAYLNDRDIWVEQVAKDNQEGFLVAFTDGSYDKELNRYSYGVILILPDGTEKSICGYGSNKDYLDTTNVTGEIFGVINAFDWALSYGFEKIKIYHDYEGLSKWISGEWKTNAKSSKMYYQLYTTKFKDLLNVEFCKVPSHSNIVYNEKADQIAKSALVDKKREVIQGENWFVIPYINKEDFDSICELLVEENNNLEKTISDNPEKVIYHFDLLNDRVTATLYKTGQHKLLIQGKNSYLLQVITTLLVELDDNTKVEQILGSAYRISIKKDRIEKPYCQIEYGLPTNYPSSIKRLIKQSIINLNYGIESEDYSQYAFPALRALEGHIKYLITLAGGQVGRTFTCFNKSPIIPNRYIISETFPDTSKNQYIETCYNYYMSQRNTIFHFGDTLNLITDNTRIIETKEESDEIILKCIDLISTQQ